mmetsp:Transcript_30410/g.51238  ORF Transcript_30410/g.51238 Transcript_30410/m.51238 type:complete len:463 (+) Transcript_30410:273-1661(+)
MTQALIEAHLTALNPLPLYVVSLGKVRVPLAACIKEDVKRVPRGSKDGPWQVDVYLNGPVGGPYHTPEGNRVRLEFSSDYPKKCPTIEFMSIIHHMHLDKRHQPQQPFFDTLKKTYDKNYEIANLLEALGEFFKGPFEHEYREAIAKKWKLIAEYNKERTDSIEAYRLLRKHPQLFDTAAGWQDEWFDKDLLSAVASNTPEAWKSLFKWETDEVYSFPLFTAEFCTMFLEEVEHYQASGLPIQRPNSMNNYGIVTNEIGMEHMFDLLQKSVLQRVAGYLYAPQGWQLDRHHTFVVQYQMDQDAGLDMHTDDSDVTFNVCLGREFEGSGLTFCGQQGAPNHRQKAGVYKHVMGRCVVHLGRKRHGADDITKGERRNLIIWNQSSAWRQSDAYRYPPYLKEQGPPDPACVSFTHDRDFGHFREYPPGAEEFVHSGWCPPEKAQYDGFIADGEFKSDRTCSLFPC